MIIVLRPNALDEEIAEVEQDVRKLGYEPHTIKGDVLTVVAAIGDETTHASLEALRALPAVDNVLPVQKRFKLISRQTHPDPHVVEVGDKVKIGGGVLHVIAGPCSVESLEQTVSTAEQVKAMGATLLRGGAFKPRTSPYDFQGLGEKGLEILAEARRVTGLPIVTEVLRETDVPMVAATADVLQIGARNGLNYALLEVAASAGKPILLKRSMAAKVDEWLLAAEYIVKRGNPDVILCERGIRTFETATRNTLDLSAVAIAKMESRLPVLVDPSHAAGRWDLIPALSKAAIACGADGLVIEVHCHPESALSDGAQQVTPDTFGEFMRGFGPHIEAAGKQKAWA
jgi:3-deoxy-7-phosphoheptulonate synthase